MCEIESEPSVHLVISQLISLRSLVCSALDFFISGDTADVDFYRKLIQLMEDIWINVLWSSVSGLVLSHLLRAEFTLKQIRGELFYQTLSLRQVTVPLEFVMECKRMHLSHRRLIKYNRRFSSQILLC